MALFLKSRIVSVLSRAVTCCLLPVVSRVVSVLRFFSITCSPLFPDMLAVPDFLIGAMEDWGLVMFRRSYLVYDEQFCSTDVKLAMTKVIAHELAHQVIYAANHLVKMVCHIIFQTTVKRTAPSVSMMRSSVGVNGRTLRFRPQTQTNSTI